MKIKNTVHYLVLSIFVLIILSPAIVSAKETTHIKKTQAEIDTYKAKLRLEKADEIEARKAEAKRLKSQAIETRKITEKRIKTNLRESTTAGSKIENLKAKREDLLAKRCEKVESMVQTRVKNFENNKQNHIDIYNRVHDKLITADEKLKGMGYDTAQLEKDIVTLDSLSKEYASEYAYFISLIRGSEQYVCGKSSGDYKSALQEARDQLKVAHEARKAIVDFYKNNIRKDIKDLRSQKPRQEKERKTNSSTLGL